MRAALLAFAAIATCAWAQVGAPVAGCLLDDGGRVRVVLGTGGVFVPGAVVAQDSVSAACNSRLALAKTGGEVVWVDLASFTERRWNAPAGSAVFGFGARGPLASFPDGLYRLEGPEWTPVEGFEAPPGEVLGVAEPAVGGLVVLTRQDGSLWLRSRNGEATRIGADSPAALLADGSVAAAGEHGLIIERPDGSREAIELPASPNALRPFGDGWIEARTAQGRFAVRAAPGSAAVFRLPEVAR